MTSISSDMWKGLYSLEYVYIGHNRIREIRDFAFKYLTHLKLIYLRSNFITKINQNMFIGLSNLEDLDLSSNEIISIDQNSFHGVQNLKRLSLARNKLLNFDGYSMWSINFLVNVEFNGNPMLSTNLTQDNSFKNIYEKEISLLRTALRKERRKVEARDFRLYQQDKELKYLKEQLDKTEKKCGEKEDEFQKFIEERQKELERSIMSYLQENLSESWEDIKTRFNWNRNIEKRNDDKNRQEIPPETATIFGIFRGSAEMVFGALASGVAFILVFVGSVVTYLLVSIGRLFKQHRSTVSVTI